jgi:hypothetical protein
MTPPDHHQRHERNGLHQRHEPNGLQLVKIAGALGLLAGIVYRPLGIAAAIGVVLYFLGAVITHVRGGDKSGGDKKGSRTPAVIMLVAVAPLVLGFATV